MYYLLHFSYRKRINVTFLLSLNMSEIHILFTDYMEKNPLKPVTSHGLGTGHPLTTPTSLVMVLCFSLWQAAPPAGASSQGAWPTSRDGSVSNPGQPELLSQNPLAQEPEAIGPVLFQGPRRDHQGFLLLHPASKIPRLPWAPLLPRPLKSASTFQNLPFP